MGKTPKLKNRAVTKNSRAARRATSPTLAGNIDKSLLELPRASSPKQKIRSVLSAHVSGGISKKQHKRGQQTRHQRLRKEKGAQRADEFSGKMDAKAARNAEKAKKIKERAKAWEELNGSKAKAPVNKFDALRDEDAGQNEWIDVEEEEAVMDDVQVKDVAEDVTAPVPVPSEQAAAIPLPAEEEDEIL